MLTFRHASNFEHTFIYALPFPNVHAMVAYDVDVMCACLIYLHAEHVKNAGARMMQPTTAILQSFTYAIGVA
jgi:hypothetical protein